MKVVINANKFDFPSKNCLEISNSACKKSGNVSTVNLVSIKVGDSEAFLDKEAISELIDVLQMLKNNLD